jgi:DNA-directed RNA polymerase specialized sigma24 family protein
LEDIAAVTEAPLGTVKSRLYRGLNLLMGRLEGTQA